MAPLKYSPQIDGLRALAVLAVFVFHNTEQRLPGGFLGVDLFFVLSGYLITRLLIVEHNRHGRIALQAFYARRIRRLLPASLTVLLAVAAWTRLFGQASALIPNRNDIFAALAYVANWRFIITDVDYFGAVGADSPLRHFWSLAVEEQFYFVWPLLALLALRFGRRRDPTRMLMVITCIAALGSLIALQVVYDPGSPTRAYFGTDTRAHQMLIGALFGILQARGVLRFNRFRSVVQAVTLIGFVILLFITTGQSVAYFRGGSAAIAVLVGLLITSTVEPGATVVDRALTWTPVQGIGRVSYAVYLWHWPVILWITYPDGAGFVDRRILDVVRFSITMALSVASFHIFENAIRRGKTPWMGSVTWRTFAVALTSSLVVFGIAHYLLTPKSDDVAQFAASDQSVTYCRDEPTPCVYHQADLDRPLVVTMGDSLSQQLSPAFVELAKKYDFTYVQAGIGGCGIDGRRMAKGKGTGTDRFLPGDDDCPEKWAQVMTDVEEMRPDLVVVGDGQMLFRHENDDGDLVDPGTREHLRDVTEGHITALRRIAGFGATVVFLEPLPTLPNADCLAEHSAKPDSCATSADVSDYAPYVAPIRTLSKEPGSGVRTISLLETVCPDGSTCPPILDGIVASYDGRHFTKTMMIRLAPAIDRLLRVQGISLSKLQ